MVAQLLRAVVKPSGMIGSAMTRPRRVSLFATCIIDQFFPQVGMSVVRVLERCGLEVDFPEGQTCCGQPAFNSGYHPEARAVAQSWLKTFGSSEAVVAPSGSCVSMIRNFYSELFHDSPSALAEARALAARTYEFGEFLVNVLKMDDVGAPARPGVATLH